MAPAYDPEHPIAAWTGILSVAFAILLILWARIEVHGTHDLESALTESPVHEANRRAELSSATDRAEPAPGVDDAVAAARWVAGFSP
jgi:hypothetical protein